MTVATADCGRLFDQHGAHAFPEIMSRREHGPARRNSMARHCSRLSERAARNWRNTSLSEVGERVRILSRRVAREFAAVTVQAFQNGFHRRRREKRGDAFAVSAASGPGSRLWTKGVKSPPSASAPRSPPRSHHGRRHGSSAPPPAHRRRPMGEPVSPRYMPNLIRQAGEEMAAADIGNKAYAGLGHGKRQ